MKALIMLAKCLVTAALLAVFAAPAQAVVSTQPTTFTETLNGSTGEYTIFAGDLGDYVIIGFAVDNSASVSAYSGRSGWTGAVVGEEAWDSGFEAVFDFGDPWFVTGDSPGIGLFDSFFGPAATQANLYWLDVHYGIPIVSNETAGGFFFETEFLASDMTLLLSPINCDPCGPVIALPVAPANDVPEPMTLGLLGAGLAGIGLARRRRA